MTKKNFGKYLESHPRWTSSNVEATKFGDGSVLTRKDYSSKMEAKKKK